MTDESENQEEAIRSLRDQLIRLCDELSPDSRHRAKIDKVLEAVSILSSASLKS